MKKISLPFFDILLCIAASMAMVLASPGLDFYPAAFVAFGLIFYIFDRKRIKPWLAAFVIGLIFYIITLSWLSVPMILFGGAPTWVGVMIAIFASIVAAALFWLPLGIVAARSNSVVLISLVLVALEMAKGKYFFGGVPWLNIAQSQHTNVIALQFVSLVGEYGLSFMIVMIGGYAYTAIKEQNRNNFTILIFLVALLFGYGSVASLLYPLPDANSTVRVVQTGINQEDKWDYEKQDLVLDSLLDTVDRAMRMEGEYDVMLLPESSFNLSPFTTKPITELIKTITADHGLLISYDRRVANTDGDYNYYNSMGLMRLGAVVQEYDKMKLAPFGEYFPLEQYFYPVREFFFGTSPLFSPGSTPVVFEYNHLRIAPLICFEASFSALIRPRILAGANVLAVASNESWFGKSLGKDQRLATDKLHAVEYGRYMLRATQDGVSALINPYGVVEIAFPRDIPYFVDMKFATIDRVTPFTHLGYSWYLAAILFYALNLRRTKQKSITNMSIYN